MDSIECRGNGKEIGRGALFKNTLPSRTELQRIIDSIRQLGETRCRIRTQRFEIGDARDVGHAGRIPEEPVTRFAWFEDPFAGCGTRLFEVS
ncbi:hypothetical protein E4U42_005450 [Claviceps africana]|uniref:Uncharacterized protein n=1 Tax=Claviceps africana TaxID=83212 RepID=A0A8K0J4P3_9HYPO|nr:hypothetical protein E4U42_005450 [Claviceps africana]